MTKNGIRGCITLAIILIVYSVIAFVAPFQMTAPFWIAYIFGVIAIVYQIYVFKISFTKREDVKSKFYGFPIAKIGAIYLVVQLVLSFVEMCLAAFISTWVTIIINIIPIAVASIGCIAADVIRDEIIRQDIQLKKDVSNMRELQSLSAALVGQCSDETFKIELQKLSEEFKYSDPVSSEKTKEIEKDLYVQMKKLQTALIEGDIEGAKAFCGELLSELSERNRVCELSK